MTLKQRLQLAALWLFLIADDVMERLARKH